MSESFSQATASFLSNLIELGVCGEPTCCNAYYPLPADFGSIVSSMLEAAGPASEETYLGPAVAVPAPLMHEASEAARESATTSGTSSFPVGQVGRHLTSSFAELSMPLQHFVHAAFAGVSNSLEVRLETLLYGLCLLERVQRTNVLEHQRRSVELRDSMSSLTNSAADVVTGQLSSSGHSSRSSPATSSSPSGRPCTQRHRPSLAGSSTVGPLTDAEAAPSAPAADLCSPALYFRLPPSDVQAHGCLGEQDTSTCPISRRSCCSVCRGSTVFGVQYFNVHLFLAACLHLSIQINEATALAAMPEDKVLASVAAACGCTEQSLVLTERVVCETLHFNLSVTPAAVDGLLRRLGAVEACV